MNNNALILGCGNIAPSHVRALKRLNCNVFVADTDMRKASYFADLYSVRTYTADISVNFQIVSLCVPIEYRRHYFMAYSYLFDKAENIVIEKPLRDINGYCDEFVRLNINRIWTPYLRVFGLPNIGEFKQLIVKETNRYIKSTDTLKETVFDLFPHWLAVISKYKIRPTGYSISKSDTGFKMVISDENKINKAEIIFEKGQKKFQVIKDNQILRVPENVYTFSEVIKYPGYYLLSTIGGPFCQFYKAVAEGSTELRRICDDMFNLTSWIKINEL